jgi:hypothetical protein
MVRREGPVKSLGRPFFQTVWQAALCARRKVKFVTGGADGRC